jgi:hypothetical protein
MKIPGEAIILKLIDTFESGVGAIARPWIAKRDSLANAEAAAEARRVDRLAEEKLRREIKDLRAGRTSFGEGLQLVSAGGTLDASDSKQIEVLRRRYLSNLIQVGSCSPAELVAIE